MDKRNKSAAILGVVLVASPLLYAQRPLLMNIKQSDSGSQFLLSHSSQGYFGVYVKDVTDDQVSVLKLSQARGAEVVSVDHDAPAFQAGVKEHDVIIEINGQSVEGVEQFRRMVRETPAGRTLQVTVSREGKRVPLQVKLANRADIEKGVLSRPGTSSGFDDDNSTFFVAPGSPGFSGGRGFMGNTFVFRGASYAGVQVDQLTPQLAQYFGAQSGSGLLVKSVDDGSPAQSAGLKAGDVILRVGDQNVVRPNDWIKAIHQSRGKSVKVTLLRDKKEQTVTLTPSEFKDNHSGLDNDWFEFNFDGPDLQPIHAELNPEVEESLRKAQQELESIDVSRELEDAAEQVKVADPQLEETLREAQQQLKSLDLSKELGNAADQVRAAEPRAQAMLKAQEQLRAIEPQLREQLQKVRIPDAQLQDEIRKAREQWSASGPRMQDQMQKVQHQMEILQDELPLTIDLPALPAQFD